MLINVTQQDIDEGKPGYQRCPIALAVVLAIGRDVIVGTLYLYLYPEAIDLPDQAIEFIRRFDRRLPVAPFSFEIELP